MVKDFLAVSGDRPEQFMQFTTHLQSLVEQTSCNDSSTY